MIKIIKHWISAIQEYDDLIKAYNILRDDLHNFQEKYATLCKVHYDRKEEEEREYFWNNKRQWINKQHKARDGVNMDVRCFFQRNCTLPRFVGTHDNIAKNVLSWGIRNIQYIGDNGEFWQYAYETYLSRTGDCEDGAILMANILINSGVPYWRIRLNMGKVKGGYHAWLTYLKEDNEWYVMDWCYWAKESDGLKLKWKDAENYFTTDASWNCKYSFGGLSK